LLRPYSNVVHRKAFDPNPERFPQRDKALINAH
jgi:hypothetical protein